MTTETTLSHAEQFQAVLQKAGIGIHAAVCHGKQETKEGWKHYAWTIHLQGHNGAEAVIPYKMGLAHGIKPKQSWAQEKPKAPTAFDVIASLAMDSSACYESFADWCSNVGYDEDSRKALETYLACQESGKTLRQLCGPYLREVVEIASQY